jgi:hypothetical protein
MDWFYQPSRRNDQSTFTRDFQERAKALQDHLDREEMALVQFNVKIPIVTTMRWFDFSNSGMYVQTCYILWLDEFLLLISYQNSTLRSLALQAS